MLDAAFRFVLGDPPHLASVDGSVELLAGFTPQEFLTSKVQLRDRIHKDDIVFFDSLFSSENSEALRGFNIRLRHADGKIRCAKGSVTRTRTSSGETEFELRLADARTVKEPGDAILINSFKTLIEQTADIIYIKNRNHVFLAASRNMARLSESARDHREFAGKTDYELLPEPAADRMYQLEERAFREGRRVNEILQMAAQDGAKYWLDDRKYPIGGPDGNFIGIFGVAPDITEATESRQKLRESEEWLRDAQEIAGLSSYVLDIPNKRWIVSPELAALLGIGEDYDRAFEQIWPLIHPDDRPEMAKRFQGYFAGERDSFDSEYRIVRHTDQTVRWVHTRGRLERDAQGNPLALRGTVQDITERKQAEVALRNSEDTLQEAQRIAGVGSHVLDLTTGTWSASDTLREILGVSPDHDLSTQGWMALVHPDDRAAVGACFTSEALTQGLRFEVEHRIVRASDQAVRWVHGRGRVERDDNGNPVAVRGTIQDITERKLADAALRESKELLQLFVEHAPVALAMFDREMRYLAVSRQWLEMHSLLERDVIGESQYEVLPEVPESWREEHRRCLAGEEIPAEVRELVRADGTTQWMRREVRPWRKGDGSIGGIVIFSEDVTPRKRAEERLRLAASVFTGAREGIIITDLKGTILDVNEAFTRITGYAREEALGKNPRLLKSGLQSKEFYQQMWSSIQRDGHWSGEVWNRSKSGDIFAETLTINAIQDANGQPTQYMALFSDITDIKRHEQQIEHLAHYDALTGLPNRVLFTNRLRQAMAQMLRNKQMLAVAYFDLDGFKAINDRHGHSVGDALLTAIAFRMRRVMREGDTLGRLGGDEFAAVLLDVASPETVAPALNRMLAAAAEEVQIGEVTLRVSASCGVTYYPQPEELDADVLLRQAGQAMYQAKLAGKNRSHNFDPGKDLIARSLHENVEHIRRALANRQFVLHYQPKVNMRSGTIVGAEALLRWQHPERGLLPPGMFLPVIEDHPVVIEIGQWVVETVLEQMEQWQAEELNLPVSVNLSALELQQPDFVERLQRQLDAHPAIKPSSLELEVLETSALEDVVQTSQVLAACREIGVSVALDDFGIGYSSLTYLKRLPANVLKIDQSFVRDMTDDPENLSILEGIMGLAGAFRRQVIAEGVETVDHGLMLLQMGCELAQGYGIARPMPASQMRAWAASWRPDPCWSGVPPVHAENRPVLYAYVEHRAWLSAFEAFLLGKRDSPPPLEVNHCRVTSWLNTEKQTARGTFSNIRAIEMLHQQLHSLAAEILASQSEGRNAEGLALLEQLQHLHAKCLTRLRAFTRTGRHRAAGRTRTTS